MIVPAVLMLALALPQPGEPYVFEVPSGSTPLEAQRALLEAQRAPLFFAAPFAVRAGRVVRGAWTPSEEILGPGSTRVVVVASWCPVCHRLLNSLSRQRPQTTVILFLDDESERRGPRGQAALANAASLERYPLAFHLLRGGSGMPRVTQFPTTFVCSRTRCTPEARTGR